MKIAFFHELHAGGARRSVNEFAKRLKKDNQIDLFYIDNIDNKTEKQFFTNTFFYKFIPHTWSGHDWKAKLYKDTIELVKLYFIHKKIARFIDKQNYDLVFIEPSKFTQAPFILTLLKSKKVYYCQEPLRMVYEPELEIPKNLHGAKYYYERLNRYVRKCIDKYNIRHTDLLLANSKHTRDNIKRIYGLEALPSYMGVDTTIFKPVKKKKDIDVLFIGSYAIADGYPLLEKASKLLKRKAVIKVLAAEKQWITDDTQIRDLYCRARIAVALMHHEPFGLIPIEAMACGVPVVAVNEGGYKETIIDGKTGYLIKRDPHILAEKIDILLTSAKVCESMSKKARENMEKSWTWDKNVDKLEQNLKEFHAKEITK
jgi:glycosyltransferase involved in cell wall biosynthesis